MISYVPRLEINSKKDYFNLKGCIQDLNQELVELDIKDLKDILLIKNNSIKNDLIFYLNNPPPNFPVSGKDLLKIGLKIHSKLL